jgi:hypothetical protein
VDHATNLGEAAIEDQVSRRVRRRAQLAFDYPAVLERDDDQTLRSELVVWNPARFDDEDAGISVDAAGVAE